MRNMQEKKNMQITFLIIITDSSVVAEIKKKLINLEGVEAGVWHILRFSPQKGNVIKKKIWPQNEHKQYGSSV